MANKIKLTPRAAETLRLVRELRHPTRAELASRLGCAPATAAQYTAELRVAGLIHPIGVGRHARWCCGPEPKPTASAPVSPPSIEQVSSIWHYARRCAVHATKERT